MKCLSMVLFFLLSWQVVSAQLPKEDSLKVQLVIDMGQQAKISGQHARALILFDSASVVAEQYKMPKMSIFSRFLKTDVLLRASRTEEARVQTEALLAESIKKEGTGRINQYNCYSALGRIQSMTGNYDAALVYYSKASAVARTLGREPLEASMNMNIGIAYYFKNDFETALQHFKKYEIYQVESGENDLAGVYNNSAALYQQIGNLEEAYEYALKSLELEKNKKNKDWQSISGRYRNIAVMSRDMKKPYQALEYLAQSNRIINEKLEGNVSLYANNLTVSMVIYNDLGKIKEALAAAKEEIGILKKQTVVNQKELYIKSLNLIGLYVNSGEQEKGKKVLHEIISYPIKDSILLARTYQVFSTMAVHDKDSSKAIEYKIKELELYQKVYKKRQHPTIVKTYLDLAHLSNSRTETLQYLKLAMQNVVIAPTENIDVQTVLDHKQYISLATLESVLRSTVFEYLSFYETNQQEADLDIALRYAEWASQGMTLLVKDAVSDSDKKFAIHSLREVNRFKLKIAHLKSELKNELQTGQLALAAMENNKSILLQQALQDHVAQKIGQLPDSIQQKKQQYEQQNILLQKQIIDAKIEKKGNGTAALEEQLFESNRKLESLQQQIETNYPNYKKILSKNTAITIPELQKNILDKKTALLEYLVSDSVTYLLVVTATQTRIHALDINKTKLNISIDTFRKALSNYQFINQQKQAAGQLYIQTAYELYEQLILPAVADLAGIENLIIVPDYTLGHIPFESLLTTTKHAQPIDYAKLDYLMQQYHISYSYSAQLLTQNSNRKTTNKINLLAMASSYEKEDSVKILSRTLTQQRTRKYLIPLPAVLTEVDVVQSILSQGKIYKAEQATEAKFKQVAGNYNILHLAMHGILNTEHPMASALVFTEDNDSIEDNFLYGYEIAQMDLNADLVVLSACETGYGKFEQGEGVMSLARSFMYAGVPSAVVSLWQVNDGSTAVLMELFYENLNQGMTKSEALTAAKRNYLARATGISAHPAYWAAFVQIGDTTPIVVPQSRWYWWLGGGLLVLLLVVGIYRQQTKAA